MATVHVYPYLIYSSKSSKFEECIIVFQVLGNHVHIPCIFHCIPMVFRQGMRYFLTPSNAAQSSEILGHSFSSQPPLSHHNQHCHHHRYHNHHNWRKLHFHIFHLNVWGKSRTKALFSHRPLSTPTSHSGKHLSPAMSCACCSSWTNR